MATKRTGTPPPVWMQEIAKCKLSDSNEDMDYKKVAERFGTSIRAVRSVSTRIQYHSYHVPNPRGGTIKKFNFADFIKAIRKHVDAYQWPE